MRFPIRRVRLRSVTSSVPLIPTPKSWWRRLCYRLRTIAGCFVWVMIIAMILLLNNLMLFNRQNLKPEINNNKLPTTDTVRTIPKLERTHQPPAQPPANLHPKLSTDSVKSAGTNISTSKAGGKYQLYTGNLVNYSEISSVRVTPNEVLRRAAILLTNTHLSCNLSQVVDNLASDFPDVPLYLELSATNSAFCGSYNNTVQCIKTPKACKHSCMYNYLIKLISQQGNADAAKYVFVWDVRYDYPDAHFLALLAQHFVGSDVQVVSPCVKDFCNQTTGTLLKSDTDSHLTALPGIHPAVGSESISPSCRLTDLLPPVYLTSVVLLKRYQWDETLPYTDTHTDFLLRMRENRVGLAACTDVLISYNNICSEKIAPADFISSRWLYASNQFFAKWNVKSVYNGLGRHCQVSDESGAVKCTSAVWQEATSGSSLENQLQHIVIRSENDQRPGWKSIIVSKTSQKRNIIKYMQTSPCSLKIDGRMNVHFDRHKSLSNSNMTIHADYHYLNRSCSLLHNYKHYWRVRGFGKLPRKQVYYVVTVANDTDHMERLLKHLNKQTLLKSTNLVVVDMGRLGREQFNVSRYSMKIPTHYLYLGDPFSRSIGLKKGFDLAKKVASESNQSDPILFSVDTSMIIPTDFTRRILRNTRCGVSSYAPICYKEIGNSGYWVQAGYVQTPHLTLKGYCRYGMLGVCSSDYNRSGGWSSKWGYHWGAEDVDLIHRIQDILPYIVRVKEDNYKHSHTGANRIYSKKYYDEKNMYDGPLPVTPLTRPLLDETLTASLRDFAIRHMKYRIHLSLVEILETTLVTNTSTTGVIYDLRFINSNNEHYFILIHSI